METTIKEFQTELGIEDLGEWLRLRYIDQLYSYRDLMKELGINNARMIKRLLDYYNIPIRRGSKAVKTQWIKNPKRRKQQGKIFAKQIKGNTNRRLPDSHFEAILDSLGLDLLKREVVNSYTIVTYQCRECGYVDKRSAKNLDYGCSSSKCRQESKGEMLVENFLKDNNYDYEVQATLEGCKHKNLLFFDFKVEDKGKTILIEYQGEQHYSPLSFFGGEEGLRVRKLRDNIKRDYCRENSITLIEIPYTCTTQQQVNDFLSYYM